MTDRPSRRTVAAPSPRPALRGRTSATLPSLDDRRSATVVALGEEVVGRPAALIEALPDPRTLAPGSLVVVPAELLGGRSLAVRVLRAFGRAKTVPRVERCSALVARGFVRVGAATDAATDLAWGYVPEP